MAFIREEYWFTDKEGRRIGWLWPEDMVSILEGFYGHRRWIKGVMNDFGYSRSQIDRWKDGRAPIPKDVAQIINMLGTMRVRGIPLSPIQPNHPTGCACSACREIAAASDEAVKEEAEGLKILQGHGAVLEQVSGPKPVGVRRARKENAPR